MNHIHLIGIGGSGLSAIALLLKEKGYTVTGSDRSLSPLTRQLAAQGVIIYAGHDPANVHGADRVVRSSAIQDDNPEVQAARAQGIPVLKRQDFLAELMTGQTVVAVAGTHGKTTTTAMLAWVLTSLGQDPSYLIGGVSKNLGNNAHAGQGPLFVVEADEYDSMFLGLRPQYALVTSIEHDHPDCFPTPESYLEAFVRFVACLSSGGVLLLSADDSGARSLAQQHGRSDIATLTYGASPAAGYRTVIKSINPNGGCQFQVLFAGNNGSAKTLVEVSLQIPGEHNALNASAVLALCHRIGLSLDQAAAALARFNGTGRRFDLLGEAAGVAVIDDYAHHPTAVQATLSAARDRYPGRRIWAVWQPHTYSRTIALIDRFAHAFSTADRVLVTEIYGARERSEGFSAAQVVAQMDHPDARFVPSLAETSACLLEDLRPGDVLLVLSAGDADQVSAAVLAGLRQKERENV